MSYGVCLYCGYPMVVKAINCNGTVFVECCNPECDNKWGDQLVYSVNGVVNE